MEKSIDEYICCTCGITLAECKHWGPRCRMTGRRVCANCCYKCGHHVTFSGIWNCDYITPEQHREEVRRRSQERFDAETLKVSEAFRQRRKEQAREKAIKAAKASKAGHKY